MTPRKTRLRRPEIPVPATLAEAEELLARIGRQQREVQRIETRMADLLARTKAGYEAKAAPIVEAIEADLVALHAWAEAHRGTLLEKDRKSARVASGELGWRTSPPTVRVTGVRSVLENLKKLGLSRFIRTKEEVDKEAIRREPDAVKSVKGVSVTQQEEFWVKPFESQIERARARKVSA